MENKTAMRHHLTPLRMVIIQRQEITSAGKDMEKMYAVGGNVNQCSHYGEQYGGSSKN